MKRMWHLKLMGWLWLLLGSFWSLLAFLSLMTSAPVESAYGQPVTMSRSAWWGELITDTLEGTIFVGSALCGFGLLRRWRWSRTVVWILGVLWLAFSVLFISAASGTLVGRVLWFGPSFAIALYSLVVLLFVRYEPRTV